MKRHDISRLTFGLLAAAFLAGGAPPALAQEAPARSGQRVYIDPQTGRPSVPPPGTVTIPSEEAAGADLRYSGKGLVVEQSTVPGGGTLVRLNGRFRQEIRAHVRPDGTVVTECVPAEAPK